MHLIPFKPEELKSLLSSPQHVAVDLNNSRLDGKTSIVYLTNLQVRFSFDSNCEKSKKFDAFKEFILSKYKTNSIQLTETLIRTLSIYHNKDIGDGPNFMSSEEIAEFINDNNELVADIAEYYNSMPYTLIAMIDEYKKIVIDPMVEAGELLLKKDDKIGVNVVRLAGLEGFIEEYMTWPDSDSPKIVFEHSTKAGEHVHKLISDRQDNSTVALIYALANDKITESLTVRE